MKKIDLGTFLVYFFRVFFISLGGLFLFLGLTFDDGLAVLAGLVICSAVLRVVLKEHGWL